MEATRQRALDIAQLLADLAKGRDKRAPDDPVRGEFERHIATVRGFEAAAPLIAACLVDFGDPSEWPEDEPVADGTGGPSRVRFGMLKAATEAVPSALEVEFCIACAKHFKAGDLVLDDYGGGSLHADCAGPEPESYCNLETGESLKPGDPIPTPYAFEPLVLKASAA